MRASVRWWGIRHKSMSVALRSVILCLLVIVAMAIPTSAGVAVTREPGNASNIAHDAGARLCGNSSRDSA